MSPPGSRFREFFFAVHEDLARPEQPPGAFDFFFLGHRTLALRESGTVHQIGSLFGDLSPLSQSTSEWPLHARGLGRLTVGMTLEEARQLPDLQLAEMGPTPVPAGYCTYFRASLAGHEFRVRAVMNRVNRVELIAPGFRTATGIAVGDSLERVKAAYGGKISVEPHHYLWDQGVVLMVGNPQEIEGRAYAIAFVASPATGVTTIWAGLSDEIRQSEGCE